MYSRKPITKSTGDYWKQIRELKENMNQSDALVIGAGAGLSAAAGFTYSGKRFEDNFQDFIIKYHFRDMYSAGFYPYDTLEEYWAYWSRYIYINRYHQPAGQPYLELLELVKDKDYFVITTNVDHRFQTAGFDKSRLFYTQGDYGLWQCSGPCHRKTYDNEEAVSAMIKEQRDMRIPSGLIPYCPVCGKLMSMNLRTDETFVEDDGWHNAAGRYEQFLHNHQDHHVVFLELGVGNNTPSIIKYPFWKMTLQNPHSIYACINLDEAYAPEKFQDRAICINQDTAEAITALKDI